MRLLNTHTLELREFNIREIPDYVILSHRWSNDEISFKEFRKGQRTDSLGHRKVETFCAAAKSQVRDWVWIDTVCIDKRSSAELSEAINSMWKWYENARECYVYLHDVSPSDEDMERVHQRLWQSNWFTRGWTLQELIAPSNVVFFDNKWKKIGTRDSLVKLISAKCKIPENCLSNASEDVRMKCLRDTCVAARMSWTASRRTTRPEDQAYCLLGLFDVNMPLLYGEGAEKAFRRLQLEIIASSDDESILAWGFGAPVDCGKLCGPLAESPYDFRHCGRLFTLRSTLHGDSTSHARPRWKPPYAMTNKGLQFWNEACGFYDPSLGVEMRIVTLACFEPSFLQCVMILQSSGFNGESYRRLNRTLTTKEAEVEFSHPSRAMKASQQYYIR